MLNGIINVIKIIQNKQPGIKLIIYGLPDRTDVNINKIKDFNQMLNTYINGIGTPKVVYRFFADSINKEDRYFADNVHLNEEGYNIWFTDLMEILK
jgi:lysophospholipase L1-like esterase